jgi:hypothetical protein
MLSISRTVHKDSDMSTSEDSEYYISPSLSSSTLTMMTLDKPMKKKSKRRKASVFDMSKRVRKRE